MALRLPAIACIPAPVLPACAISHAARTPMNDETGEPTPTPDAAPTDALPRHTTPTWEVELLISGVAVFAMLQLPGWLDDALFRLVPRFDAAWGGPIGIMHVYLKSAALILATTFAIHLFLRARWIALVGMHSVYRDGVRWDKLRMGPVQREVEQGRFRNAAEAIDSADNSATTVFAMGVMLASILLMLSLLIATGFALAMAVLLLLGVHANASTIFSLCAALVMAPFVLALQFDRRFGARLREGGIARRVIAAVFRFYGRLGMGRGSNVIGLMASHGGEKRTMVLTTLIILVVFTITVISSNSMRNPLSLGNYALFPDQGAGAVRMVNPVYYDDQRNAERDAALPYIQSVVISGPYLRLVVPYQPERDEGALIGSCPAAMSSSDDDAHASAILACLQAQRSVALDGKPVAGLQYELSSDARTDRPALLAMIDIRRLPPGRHELAVPRPATQRERDAKEPPPPHLIPFWR